MAVATPLYREPGRLTPPTSYVPETYEDLFREYWDYTKALVIKFGIDIDNAEDAASTVLVKFFAQDFLPKFQSGMEFDTSSGRKKSNFCGFLTRFISLYVRQERDKQITIARKIQHHLEEPLGDGATWVEINGPTYEISDELDGLDASRREEVVSEYLRGLPIRGTRDLYMLFNYVRYHLRAFGKINRKAMAKSYGVSDTAICLMFADLRVVLTEIGYSPAALA